MYGYTTHEFDILVIGAGGAGLRAAIEASTGNHKVALICKSLLGKAQGHVVDVGSRSTIVVTCISLIIRPIKLGSLILWAISF